MYTSNALTFKLNDVQHRATEYNFMVKDVRDKDTTAHTHRNWSDKAFRTILFIGIRFFSLTLWRYFLTLASQMPLENSCNQMYTASVFPFYFLPWLRKIGGNNSRKGKKIDFYRSTTLTCPKGNIFKVRIKRC